MVIDTVSRQGVFVISVVAIGDLSEAPNSKARRSLEARPTPVGESASQVSLCKHCQPSRSPCILLSSHFRAACTQKTVHIRPREVWSSASRQALTAGVEPEGTIV